MKLTAAHIDHQYPGDRVTRLIGNQRQRSVFFHQFNRRGAHLFHQSADNFDTGKITLVYGAVEGLTGEGLMMERAVGLTIEKTAQLVFQFLHADNRGFAQLHRHILVWQPFPAVNRIHEMPLHRISRTERHVIATLHHACAAAFSDQAFSSDAYL